MQIRAQLEIRIQSVINQPQIFRVNWYTRFIQGLQFKELYSHN